MTVIKQVNFEPSEKEILTKAMFIIGRLNDSLNLSMSDICDILIDCTCIDGTVDFDEFNKML